ncbi:receptor-type tyrosine-protein phosphatase epsilon-like [Diadema setosum]|uniref:receptor-type tyrosine-protein phosphatase epsilon-like n=1 Tax=Diadema setosum TaxID=31175 RepID=UPI003B3AF443
MTSFLVGGLLADTDYDVAVSMVREGPGGTGAPSPSASITTNCGIAPPPTRLYIIDRNATTVRLTWSIASPSYRNGNVTGYEVWYDLQDLESSAVGSKVVSTLPETDIFPHEVASKPANFAKNRYRNILPYDSSRVQLDFINGDPHSDYYNASYISSFDRDRAYIASQGPNTASLDDFWRMVWQKRVRVIVMLTNLEEGMRVKCIQYWPEETNECIAYGAIDVTLLSAQKITDWVKRTMVLKKGPNSRRVCQYHYRAWPDKDVPRHSASLLKFLRQVRAEYDGGGGSPLLVHCSAGVGRTGVVIAIDSVVAHARRSERVEVYKFVKYMRHRRPFMVQTPEQYQFVYNTVLEDLLWEETEIPGKNFSLQLARLKRNVRGRMHSRLNQEFQKLKTLCPDPPECSMRSGKMAENRSKNRYGNTLPLQRNRVILQTRDSPEADYINASFVRVSCCSFITTQMPMPNTVCDFWTMVADYKPAYIIMLNENYGTDKSDVQYWPDSGYRRYGPYTISASVIKQDVDIIVRCLTVESSWGKQSRCEISSPRILGFERAKSRDVRSRHLEFLDPRGRTVEMWDLVTSNSWIREGEQSRYPNSEERDPVSAPALAAQPGRELYLRKVTTEAREETPSLPPVGELLGLSSPGSLLVSSWMLPSRSDTVGTGGLCGMKMNGVGRTGVFCAVMECIHQLDKEGAVDVFQTVKMLRVERPHMVQTEEEYFFTYDTINEYIGAANDVKDEEDVIYVNTDGKIAGESSNCDEAVYANTDGKGLSQSPDCDEALYVNTQSPRKVANPSPDCDEALYVNTDAQVVIESSNSEKIVYANLDPRVDGDGGDNDDDDDIAAVYQNIPHV